LIFQNGVPQVFIGGEQFYPRGLMYSNKHNFAPRIGIAKNLPRAWLAFGAAYGIFFTPAAENTWCNQRHNVPYVFPETQQADNFAPPAALFTSGLNFGTPVLGNGTLKPTTVSFTAFDPNAPVRPGARVPSHRQDQLPVPGRGLQYAKQSQSGHTQPLRGTLRSSVRSPWP